MARAETEAPVQTADVARAYFEAHGRQDIDTVAELWEPGGVGVARCERLEVTAGGGFG